MARRRARRAAARIGERDAAGAVQRRALRGAGGRDGAVRRLQAVRRRDRRPHPRPDDPAASHRRDRRRLRARVLDDDSRRGAVPVARDARRRPARRDLAARRRQGEPDRPDHGASEGRPAARGPRRRADPRARRAGPRRRRDRRAHRPRRRGGRGRRQLCRAVGRAGRGDGRRAGAAALGRALLRGHRPGRGRAPRPADPAGPRRLHLLQGGGRRPGGRRLRARGQAVGVAGRRSPTRSSSRCSTRTGSTSRC